MGTVKSTCEDQAPIWPRVVTVKSTCKGQAPTLPKGGNCQIYLHRPSPHLAQGWGLSNPLAQAKPPPCPKVGTVKSTCMGQAPTLPKGGDCQIHLHRPSPHLAQGWGLSNPLAQAKPPPCPRVGTVKSTCAGQAPTLPEGGDCQIHLHGPSPHLAQGWRLSNPLARAKPPPCPRVGTVKSTCTGEAPTLPKDGDSQIHLHTPTPVWPKGGDYQIHLHRPSPHLAQGCELSNPLARAKPPPCPMVGTIKSTCTGQASTLPKGGNCQIHVKRRSPHLAQGWILSNPLAQAKPQPCPRVGTVKSTCTGQAPILPKGANCENHLHKPRPHLAQGWGLSNPLAQTKPPPCSRVRTIKSTCTGQTSTLPNGGDRQIHLHRPSPRLAQRWELSNPLARTNPPPCPRMGTVKSTCTGPAPTLPKDGDCQIHLHRLGPHLAQGIVRWTCTGRAPTLPKGGVCQIHLHRPSPHLAQGWELSTPLAQAKPPSCPRVRTVKTTCTNQGPTLPKGGDCQIHLHRPSPHLAQGCELSNPLARAKPPPCPMVGTVKSTCTDQAPVLPKGGNCQIHLHGPTPHLAQGWELSNPLARAQPPPCPRTGTVKSTCTD